LINVVLAIVSSILVVVFIYIGYRVFKIINF